MSTVSLSNSGTTPDISELERTTMKKIYIRIIPYVIFAYFLCFIDRINVSFAGLTMRQDLALTAEAFGMGAGIFFIGYFLAEVPSNILLEKFGARVWIARIMITWGALSALMYLVQGETSFYVMRFLLGVAEAGFFPGIIFYFTYWFPARYRAKVSGRFLMASPLSTMVGAPLSTWILSTFDGVQGMHGWQWLFIVEGIPTVIFGVFTLFYLTERPSKAVWLTDEEKEWIESTLKEEREQIQSKKHFGLKDALLSPIVLVLGLVYFCTQMPPYGFFMWIPQVVQSFGELSKIQIGLISAIPAFFAIVGLYVWGWSSDRTMERKWHFIIAALLAGGSMIVGVQLMDVSPVLVVVCLSICAMGMYGLMAVFWTVPPMFLTGAAAAGGIAFVNSIGNLGGFAGPYAMGWFREKTGSFGAGLTCLAGVMFLAALLGYIIITQIQNQQKKT